jgi:hypothetical protein
MAKRGPIAITCVAAVVLVVLALLLNRSPVADPVYEGRTLSHWLVVLADSSDQPDRDRAVSAVQNIGTNGFPELLQMLRTPESPWKSRLLAWRWYHFFALIHFWEPADARKRAEVGFIVLGTNAALAAPDLAKILDENSSRDSVECTAMILGNIGPGAKAAVPALVRAAKEPSQQEHYEAIRALGKIHSEAGVVVPFLTGLVSSHSHDRIYAVIALGKFGGEAVSAVPDLVAMLSDPTVETTSPRGTGFVTDREQVEQALQQIDPETYARVVTNSPTVTGK